MILDKTHIVLIHADSIWNFTKPTIRRLEKLAATNHLYLIYESEVSNLIASIGHKNVRLFNAVFCVSKLHTIVWAEQEIFDFRHWHWYDPTLFTNSLDGRVLFWIRRFVGNNPITFVSPDSDVCSEACIQLRFTLQQESTVSERPNDLNDARNEKEFAAQVDNALRRIKRRVEKNKLDNLPR